ncbi:MAG: hypothetical protein EXS31_00775 [Pedosphaera sp.]|nr:hypothetical protein [Pedosphaera sp.]
MPELLAFQPALDGREPIPLGPLAFYQLFRLNHVKRITDLSLDVNGHTIFHGNSHFGPHVVTPSDGVAWENPTPVVLPTPLRLKPGLRTATHDVPTSDGRKQNEAHDFGRVNFVLALI